MNKNRHVQNGQEETPTKLVDNTKRKKMKREKYKNYGMS